MNKFMKTSISNIKLGDKNITSKDPIKNATFFYEEMFKNIFDLSKQVNTLVKSIEDDLHICKNSSSVLSEISENQTSSVSTINSTIKKVNTEIHNVSISIEEIYRITLTLTESFNTGFELIKKNISKMHEIEISNTETLKGVQFLSEKIENIWDIVNIINEIADQTKIIAFNAELEATAAGAAGRNFRIVASEIRRLADNTVNSTSEIKERITEIQHSSDSLIISSETGTERIKEGNNISEELEKVFEDVLNSTEIATASTEGVSSTIKTQTKDFESIICGMKDISTTIKHLSNESLNVSQSFDKIKVSTTQIKDCLIKNKMEDMNG
ncbi:MAG: methyl-accepting chemotaxis protein [Spirochaetales bacterium]|nr:methyl-accepting chemotaxis protein [Spirochaetales bacterium]